MGVVRPLIASAALGLVLLAVAFGAAWLSGQTIDHDTAAEGVAVSYTRAVLTLDYSAWWDSVSPGCRAGPDTRDKALWMDAARQRDAQTGRMPAPSNVVVTARGTTGSGSTRTVHVRDTDLWSALSDYVDVTLRLVGGRWGVTNRTAPGSRPAHDCDVWIA